jgi:hypothetical protein
VSYDLFVYCAREVTVSELNRVLAGANARLDVEDDTDLREHTGVLPVRVERPDGPLETGPEWYAEDPNDDDDDDDEDDDDEDEALPEPIRAVMDRCVVYYMLSGSAQRDDAFVTSLLAAAVARAGDGVVCDPQDSSYRTADDAWAAATR